MTRAEAVFSLLEGRGAAATPHGDRHLLAHLRGTHAILKRWSQEEEVCLAGAAHSAYGTHEFDGRVLSVDDRAYLRDAIGERAERLARLFGTLRRRAVVAAARAGEPSRIGLSPADAGALVVIEMANHLEQDPGPLYGSGTVSYLGRLGSALEGLGWKRQPPVVGEREVSPEQDERACARYARARAESERDWDAAQAGFEAVCEILPSVAEPRVLRALGHARAGDWSLAITFAGEAERLFESWAVPWDKTRTLAEWVELAANIRRISVCALERIKPV